MKRDDIIRMAHEVGYPLALYGDGPYLPPLLVMLLEKPAPAEREACAKECDIQASFGNPDERFGARQCAHAIRTRGRA